MSCVEEAVRAYPLLVRAFAAAVRCTGALRAVECMPRNSRLPSDGTLNTLRQLRMHHTARVEAGRRHRQQFAVGGYLVYGAGMAKPGSPSWRSGYSSVVLQAIASGLATRGAVEALAAKPYIGPSAVRAYLANAIGAAAPALRRDTGAVRLRGQGAESSEPLATGERAGAIRAAKHG